MNNDSVCVVVLDHEGSRLGASLDEDIATTLIAVASEDPDDWTELVACWPRYTTRAAPEFASLLPIEIVDRRQAMGAVGEMDCWIVLDLVNKRFLSSTAFQPITRDACFAMHTDENGDQHDPLSVHLPPWWELHEQVDPSEIDQPRRSPINIPVVNREFLFGQPLIQDLADRLLKVAGNRPGRDAILSSEHQDLYPFTIEVHRDWLMTPQEKLGGMFPRQMLHGGVDWLGKIVWGLQLRFERDGGKMVALPTDVRAYRQGPMGGEEMAIYFDLCRELIGAGWSWCKNNLDKLPGDARQELIQFLNVVKTDWMNGPFEGGSPPAFILECSRRRVPRGAGVEIVGMTQRESEQHVIDCDCPICNMMADGAFGVGFSFIDGHHLDLDDEFAFSTHETHEAWEEQQHEYAELSAKWDREREERERKIAAGELEAKDEFASAWTGIVSDEPLPGDSSGNLKLAFLLAEIVSELQRENDSDYSEPETADGSEGITNSDTIKRLNDEFSEYRTCEGEGLGSAAKNLSATLEMIAQRHPELLPRVADFQSRIEERLRAPVSDDDFDYDLPF